MRVWQERAVPDGTLRGALVTDTWKSSDTVVRLKLHLSVMQLIFEIDMPFHLLIKKEKNLKGNIDQMWICMPRCRLWTVVLVFRRTGCSVC